MQRLVQKRHNRQMRKMRVSQSIKTSQNRTRLSVYISNRHVIAQLIDDNTGKTLVYISTVKQKDITRNLTDKAIWVGQQIAKAAIKHKIKKVTFDRGNRLFHGRIKALATAAKEAGLEF